MLCEIMQMINNDNHDPLGDRSRAGFSRQKMRIFTFETEPNNQNIA